jgi:hypothetical protein
MEGKGEGKMGKGISAVVYAHVTEEVVSESVGHLKRRGGCTTVPLLLQEGERRGENRSLD